MKRLLCMVLSACSLFMGFVIASENEPKIKSVKTGWVSAILPHEERAMFRLYGALIPETAHRWMHTDTKGVCSIVRFKSDVQSEAGIILEYAHLQKSIIKTLFIPLNVQERPRGTPDAFKVACLQKVPDLPDEDLSEDVLYYYHANIE